MKWTLMTFLGLALLLTAWGGVMFLYIVVAWSVSGSSFPEWGKPIGAVVGGLTLTWFLSFPLWAFLLIRWMGRKSAQDHDRQTREKFEKYRVASRSESSVEPPATRPV